MPQPKKEPITVRDLLNNIMKLKLQWSITLDTPIVYASDDEWNSYQAVIATCWIMETKEPLKYWERFEHKDIADEWGHTVLCIN